MSNATRQRNALLHTIVGTLLMMIRKAKLKSVCLCTVKTTVLTLDGTLKITCNRLFKTSSTTASIVNRDWLFQLTIAHLDALQLTTSCLSRKF